MHAHVSTRALAAGLAIALSAVASAQVVRPGPQPVLYDLTATLTHGCFDPCACPISFTDEVTGTFTLEPTSLTGTLDTYSIQNVMITVGPPTPIGPKVTGSGTYSTFSEFIVTHRMELDLTTGPGGEVQHYDSGWVVGGLAFPDIDITVSINGMVCFDTVFEISATPVVFDPADLNQDGHVNGVDLALLLGQWGPCPICITTPCPCFGDLDDSGRVNGLDLAILLGAWTA